MDMKVFCDLAEYLLIEQNMSEIQALNDQNDQILFTTLLGF